jgi:hypothetical protein
MLEAQTEKVFLVFHLLFISKVITHYMKTKFSICYIL